MKHAVFTYAFIPIAVFLVLQTSCKSKEKKAPPAPAMKVMEITTTKVPVFLKMVGQAEGIPTIDIRARVAGFLDAFSFKEGTVVPKGQLLFTIEPDEYKNDLDNATADLESKNAAWDKAKLDVARLKPLLATNAISQNDYDKAVTTERQDHAAVLSAEANLAQAKLNLSYTTIYAPITGYIGKANVRPGNLVGKGEATLLATISAVDPIYVNFTMAETDYLNIMRAIIKYKEELEGKSKNIVEVYLQLSDNSEYEYTGKVDFIDRDIDQATGTIALRAVFPNPEGFIKPGTFANVFFTLREKQDGIVIPQKAVTQVQGKFFAYLLDKENKVTRVPVQLGRSIGQSIMVLGGLSAGDRIMLEGFQKFQEGMQINPVLVKDTLKIPESPVMIKN